MTKHPQVGFTTVNGKLVEVDEGMFDILHELRRLGVRTQFSCQGDKKHGGYVLADARSFYPVLRKIRSNIKNYHYSDEATRAAQQFLRGYRDYAFVMFRNRRRDEIRASVERGFRSNQRWSIEWQLDNRHGLRIIMRWPTGELDNVRIMFEETV